MPTPKKFFFTSQLLTFPLNPPGWLPVIWLSVLFPAFWNLLRITRWLGACKLHLTDFLASCFLVRFCQREALPGNWKAGVDFFFPASGNREKHQPAGQGSASWGLLLRQCNSTAVAGWCSATRCWWAVAPSSSSSWSLCGRRLWAPKLLQHEWEYGFLAACKGRW